MKKLTKTMAAHKIIAGCIIFLLLVGTATIVTAAKDEEKTEKTERAFLGVTMEPLSPGDKEEFQVKFGVLVASVVKGEGAEKAGIKKYDVIQYFNEEKMRQPEDLSDAISALKPGAKAVIKFVRDGKEMTLTATLGKAPAEKPMLFFGDNEKMPKMDFPKDKFIYKTIGGGAYLGVRLQELSADLAPYFGVKVDGGVLILLVEKDSPAQKAGLKDGDVIVQVDGKNASSPEDVVNTISKKEKGDKVEIQVIRHNKKEVLTAELGENKGNNFIRFFNRGEGEDGEIDIDVPSMHIERMYFDKLHDNSEKLHEIELQIREKLKKHQVEIEKQRDKAEKVCYTIVKKVKDMCNSI